MDEKTNGKTIETLIEYIKAMEKLEKDTEDKGLWLFRGQANKDWSLLPSIYRETDGERQTDWIENEDTMIHDIISSYPNEFPQQRSAFEKLTVMQHYGLPTRLLDVTENPLVALYFACQGESEHDGKVFVFDIPKSDIRYSDSDTVSVVANLAWLENDSKVELIHSAEKLEFISDTIKNLNELTKNEKVTELTLDKLEYIIKILKKNMEYFKTNLLINGIKNKLNSKRLEGFLTDNEKNIRELDNMVKNVQEKQEKSKNSLGCWDLEDLISSVMESLNHCKVELNFLMNTTFHNHEVTKKLLHCIRNEKPHFEPKIFPNHINSILCVKPRINNERIKRQQGAFILFGCIEGICEPGYGEYSLNKNKISIKKKIIIPSEGKKKILDSLSKIGIDETTLFPGLDVAAKAIKERYIGEEGN